MKEPLVSIITPSFNQGSYIEETILSVIGQNYKNIEYIVIDGGSNDDSVEIIKKYEKHLSYWISEKDNGQADAINKGFAKASGDLICWVNSDDILYLDFISNRVNQFKRNIGVSMIYGDIDQGWDPNHKILRKGKQQDWNEMITTGTVKVPQMSAIWKKEVYLNIGGLNVLLNVLLDWEYFVRIAKNFRILYLSGAVAYFRQHKDSKSLNLNEKWVDEMIQYYEKNIFIDQYTKQINYKHTRQNLYFFCYTLYTETGNELERRKYLKIAKEVSNFRFFRIHIFKMSKQILVRIKKKINFWR